MKKNLLKSSGVQTLLASLLCILGGLLIGFIVLLIIEPSGAWEAITSVLKSYFRYSRRCRCSRSAVSVGSQGSVPWFFKHQQCLCC